MASKSLFDHLIYTINPGSTSTKVALFQDEIQLWQETFQHAPAHLQKFERIWQQLDFRRQLVEDALRGKKVSPAKLSAVVGRGGLLRPVAGGTYAVNQQMLDDAKIGFQGEHAANLGCALAKHIADQAKAPAYVVDPISVDEFEPLARYSGHPRIARRCLSHTLNIHAVARLAARKLNLNYEQANFVVVHLGGGISVAALKTGRIVDVNDASSDGPFSPERTGGLPLQPFIRLCFSGEHSESYMRTLVAGKGGLFAYLGTNSAREVEERIADGDEDARQVYEAMAYQIAKEIGAMATVLRGDVHAIVLTGGLANSKMLTRWIAERVASLSKVLVLAGEFEMQAMALGALRVLNGEEEARTYP